MALDGSSAKAISQEFGVNTRAQSSVNGTTNPDLYKLKNMYEYIFQTTGAHSRTAFAGYGKPVVSNVSASTSSTLGGRINVSFNVDQVNNPDGNSWNYTNVQVQVSEGGGDREPTDWQNVGNSVAYGTTGAKSINGIDVPKENTTYAVRILYWNYFNNVSADHIQEPSQQPYPTATSSSPNRYPTPVIDQAFQSGGSNVYVEWTYGDEPSSFEAQWRLSGSNTWDNLILSSSSNWGTSSNPKSATWNDGKIIPSGTHEVRIRASAEGGVSESFWSQPETFTVF